MTRPITTIAVVVALVLGSSTAEAQVSHPSRTRFRRLWRVRTLRRRVWLWRLRWNWELRRSLQRLRRLWRIWGFGGYGPFNYSQQLFQQQASLTQQIFQQQQQAIIGQVQEAQSQIEKLDGSKQQLFKQYLDMSDSDKATVRAGLMNDYLNLDAHGKEGWKRDAVVQTSSVKTCNG